MLAKFDQKHSNDRNSIMACSSFSVVAILVAMNLIFISTAKPTIDDLKQLGAKRLILTKVDESLDHQTAIHEQKNLNTAFIGDIVVGSRRDGEIKLQGRVFDENPTSEVLYNTAFVVTNVRDSVFHYVKIVNDEGSYMVVCGKPDQLGDEAFEFDYRLYPNTTVNYTVYAGIHLE